MEFFHPCFYVVLLSGMIHISKLYPSKYLAKIFIFQVESFPNGFNFNIGLYCYLLSVIKNINNDDD